MKWCFCDQFDQFLHFRRTPFPFAKTPFPFPLSPFPLMTNHANYQRAYFVPYFLQRGVVTQGQSAPQEVVAMPLVV